LRTRSRNFGVGGATSVPITVSAVSEKPTGAAACLSMDCPELVGTGLTNAVTTATAAAAAIPASALFMRTA
jgi:hypothetical protein